MIKSSRGGLDIISDFALFGNRPANAKPV